MAPADGGRGCSAVNRPFKPPTFGYGVGREIVRVARFTVVGGVATMVHAGIYLLLVAGELTAPAPANLAGFVVAFGLSFAGQYGWTFRDRTRGAGGCDRSVLQAQSRTQAAWSRPVASVAGRNMPLSAAAQTSAPTAAGSSAGRRRATASCCPASECAVSRSPTTKEAGV